MRPVLRGPRWTAQDGFPVSATTRGRVDDQLRMGFHRTGFHRTGCQDGLPPGRASTHESLPSTRPHPVRARKRRVEPSRRMADGRLISDAASRAVCLCYGRPGVWTPPCAFSPSSRLTQPAARRSSDYRSRLAMIRRRWRARRSGVRGGAARSRSAHSPGGSARHVLTAVRTS